MSTDMWNSEYGMVFCV